MATADRANAPARPWYVVTILFLVTVFNLMDRQILSILLEPIKRDLGASDTVMGLLTGFAFVSFFTLASVPIARAADEHSRRNIIAGALAFWSVMTMLSGLVASALQLAAARVGLGIGEAATLPASQSMVSDLFSPARRITAISMLAVAAPVGIMLAFILGGWLNQAVGWRLTFVALGAPGLLLALLVLLTVREPGRGAAEHESADVERYDLHETVTYLWSLRSLRYLTAGASLNVFGAWAMGVWSATFLIRVHGMGTSEAGAWLGLATGVGGIAGTLGGGLAAERLARRDARWLLRVPALASLLTVPFAVLFLTLPSPLASAMYLGGAFFGQAILGPVLAVTQGLAKVRMRARAAALVGMTFNLFGAGLGPLVVGVLSDVLAPRFGAESIRYALLAPVCTVLLGSALCFGRGARHVAAELARATPATNESLRRVVSS
jgi:predicted MFS family arabinose efflux permease